MGQVHPFRRRKWTRASDYGHAPKRRVGWFPIAIVALPLAAFSAVFFSGGPPEGSAGVPFRAAPDRETASFSICDGPQRYTCVVDGDTIWYRGTKIRIADIDTPEVSRPDCAAERALGDRATLRLQALLNEGAFTLAPNPDGRSTDRYGRALNLVTRGGESLGAVLVAEGLAEFYGNGRPDWC